MQNRNELRKAMREFYNTSDYYLQWLKKPASYFSNYLYLIQKHTPLGAKVLDLGCGTGISSRCISIASFDVIGLDISLKYLKFGIEKKQPQSLKFVCGDASIFTF